MKKVVFLFVTALLFCANFLYAQCSISLTSPPGSDDQTKCTGAAISPIDYTVGGGATGAVLSGQPLGISGFFSGGVFKITGSSTQIGTFNYTVTTTGPCGTPATATGTITIIPNHTIALTSGAGSNIQTVCINNDINEITYTVGGSATGATVAGLPSGIIGSFSGGVFTISGAPTSQTGTFNFTVTTTGPCIVATATGSITVNPNASITLTSGSGTNNQTKCINNPIQNITYAVSIGVTGASVSGLPNGVTGSFSAGIFTIIGTPTQAGVFNYTVTTIGPCVQTTATGTLTINGNAILTLATGSGPKSQTICLGTALVPIAFVVSGSGTGATATGLPPGVSGSFSNGTFTISGTPILAGTFNYTVTTTGPCLQAFETGTIKVNPNITISLTSGAGSNIQTRCIDSAITNITYAIGTGGTGATVTGLPTGVTGNFASGVFTISGTPTQSGTFAYIVQPVGPCNLATASGTITVTPNSVLTLTSGTNSNNQTRCLNTAITNITYAITGGGTGATVVGLPSGVAGVFASGVFTISGTPTQAGTFNYTVTTTGPCVQATASGTLIINTNSTVVLSSAPNTNNQTVCAGATIVNIEYTVGGAGTGATVSGLPAGVSGSFSGTVFTISGTPTAVGTFNYTVTPVGPCILASATGTIVVNPNATIVLTSGANSNNQAKCINTPIQNITYAVGGGGTGATVTGLPNGVNGTFASGVLTISGTATVSGLFNYTVTTTGNCTQTTATGTLLINANSTIALSSAPNSDNQTTCQSNPILSIAYTIGGGGTGATVVGLPSGITGSFAGGVFTISGAATVTGTFNYTVTTTGPCGQATATGTIVVNPNATISLTSGAGTNNQTICLNSPISNIVYAIGGGGTGTTVAGLPSGVSGSSAGNVFTISGTPTQTGVFTYTVTTNGSCSPVNVTGTITINTNATIVLTSGPGSSSQTVCINKPIAPITYAIGGGGSGAIVNGLPVGLSGSFAAGVFTITGAPILVGTFNYVVQTTGTCAQTSIGGTITVTSNQTITLATGSGATSQQICINTLLSPIKYNVGGGGTGATVTGLPTGIDGSFSNGTFTISGQPTVAGVFNYQVTTSGSCEPAITSGTITVNPDASLVLSSGSGTNNQTVCINTKMVEILFTATGATAVTASGLPTGLSGSFSSNVFKISGTPILAGTYNYNIITTGPCKNASASGTITVLPNATISLTSGIATINQTLCANIPIQNITYAIGGSGTGAITTGLPAGITGSFQNGIYTISGTPTQSGTFNFLVTTTGNCGQVTASGILNLKAVPILSLSSNSPLVLNDTLKLFGNHNLTGSTFTWSGPLGFSSTLQNPIRLSASLDMSGIYSVTVTNNGCSTVGTINVIVNPKLKATIVNAGKDTICTGDTLKLTANPVDPKYKYTWNTGDTIATLVKTPVTNTSYLVTIVDVATGFVSLDTIDIVVNATPQVVQLTNFSRCSGLAFDLPDFSISPTLPGAVNFTWTNNNNAIGLSSTGSGQVPIFTPVFNDSGSNIDGEISYSATVNGCKSSSKAFRVTVFPRPNAAVLIEEKSGEVDNDRIVCESNTITLSATSNQTPGPFDFEWNSPSVKGAKVNDNPAGPISGVGAKVYVVTVTDANGCKNTATDSIVINKVPIVTSITIQENSGVKANDSAICSKDTVVLTANEANGSDGNYAFEWSLNNIKTKSLLVNPEVLVGPGISTYQVTVSNRGCRSTKSIDVVVFGLPTADFSSQGKLNTNSNIIWKDESKINGTSAIKNWLWNFQNSSIPVVSQSTPSNITNSFFTAGNNLVTLKITDVNNCMDVKSKIIKVEESGCNIKLDNFKNNYCLEMKGTEISTLVNFNVSVQTTEVSPNMVGKFDALPSGLVWETNPAATDISGNTTTNYSRTIKATAPGTYTIRLRIEDDTTSSLLRCNANIFTATFTINDIPRVSIKFLPTSICNGDAATVSLNFPTGKNPFAFKYNNATNDSTSTELVKQISIKKADYANVTNNFYLVCIAAIKDGNGCENKLTSICDSLPIKPLPTITGLSDLNLCQNQQRPISVQHNKPDNNQNGYQYIWSSSIAGVKFDSINKVNPTVFVAKGLVGKLPINVIVVDTISGCRSERVDSIIVSNTAAPETDTIFRFISTNAASKNTFLHLYPKANFCFKWLVEDGKGGFKEAACLNGKNDLQYCELDSPEKVVLRVWNCNAPECSSLVTVIRSAGEVDPKDRVSIYPNPTDGNLVISFEDNRATLNQLTVTDILGRVVWTQKVVRQNPTEKLNLDLQAIESGAYYLIVEDELGAKQHFKFIVQK